MRVLVGKSQNDRPQRRLEWRPTWCHMRVRPMAGDQLAVPTLQRVRLHWKPRPGRSGQRAAQRSQQCTIRPGQLRPRGVSAQDGELMAQDEDLELLRTSLPPEQPHEREQVPNDEI